MCLDSYELYHFTFEKKVIPDCAGMTKKVKLSSAFDPF